jgi:hypothetical protein
MDRAKQVYVKQLYDSVFDAEGNVMLCGRQACAKLIQALQPYSSENLGDVTTGIMNVENIKKAYAAVTAV